MSDTTFTYEQSSQRLVDTCQDPRQERGLHRVSKRLISQSHISKTTRNGSIWFLDFLQKKQWFLFEISTIIVEWSTVNTVRFNF